MINSVTLYRTLKYDILRAMESYSNSYINRCKNGTIRIYHKVRLVLLKRYADYILNRQVIYTTHSSDTLYKEKEIVTDGTYMYICFKDTVGSVAVTDKNYWSPYPTFTYDYDEIISVLDKINRICGSNLTI